MNDNIKFVIAIIFGLGMFFFGYALSERNFQKKYFPIIQKITDGQTRVIKDSVSLGYNSCVLGFTRDEVSFMLEECVFKNDKGLK